MRFSHQDLFRNSGGFTLVELITSLVISFLIAMALYSTYAVTERAFSAQENVTQAQQSGRMAMTLLERDIRGAGAMGYGFPKGLTFHFSNAGNAFDADRPELVSDVLDVSGITGERESRIDPLMIQDGGYPTGGAAGTMTLSLEGSAFGYDFSSGGYTAAKLKELCPAPDGTNSTGCLFIVTKGGNSALVEGTGTVAYPGTVRHGENGNTLVDIQIQEPPGGYDTDPVLQVLTAFRGSPTLYYSEGNAFYLGVMDKAEPERSPVVRYTVEEDAVGGTYNLLRNRQILVQGVEDLQFAFLAEGDPLVPLCSWNDTTGAVTSCAVNAEDIRTIKVGMVITETDRERKAEARADYRGGVVIPNPPINLFNHRYNDLTKDMFVRRLYTSDVFWRNFGG